jgi:hypothetical protein
MSKRIVKTSFLKYLGICICPKCGKKGYKKLVQAFHSTTKTISVYHSVLHQHTVHINGKHKTIYDGNCYFSLDYSGESK